MLRFALLSIAVVSLWPLEALAGGCPQCATSADCTNGFCVQWTENPGCGNPDGGFARICCPGQGCNLSGGRPSCEDAGRCIVVGGSGTGGGTAGTGGGAAGTGGGTTTGTGGGASGSTGGGTGTNPGGGGGCSCGASPGVLAALGLLAAVRARRRR